MDDDTPENSGVGTRRSGSEHSDSARRHTDDQRGWFVMRRILLVALGGFTLLVAGAGLGWACTTQNSVSVSPSPVSPQVAQVSVDGHQYYRGQVEIIWTPDDGESSHLKFVEVDEHGRFSTDINIPDEAGPGVYYVTGVWTKDGSTYKATDALTIKEPEGSGGSGSDNPGTATQQADGGPTEGSNGSGNDTPSETSQPSESSNDGGGATAGDQAGTDGGSRGQAQPGRASSGGSSGQALQGGGSSMPTSSPEQTAQPSQQQAATSQSDPQPAQRPESAGEPAPTQQIGADQPPEQEPTSTPQSAPQQSVAEEPAQGEASHDEPTRREAPQPAGGDREAGTHEVGAEPAPQPAAAADEGDTPQSGRADTEPSTPTEDPLARTGSGDLWSGLSTADGDTSSLTTGLNQAGATHGETNTGGQLTLALSLLAGGALTLLSGGFALAARRRRALATTQRS